jgi:hypothetical protein
MEQIISSLQSLQLSSIAPQNPSSIAPQNPSASLTNEQLSALCLNLYNENVSLKNEIIRLRTITVTPPSRPKWVH